MSLLAEFLIGVLMLILAYKLYDDEWGDDE